MAAEFLKCTICYDTFHRPRILACLHTFCEGCLEKHIEANNASRYSERTGFLSRFYGTFPCPTCREEIHIPTNGVAGFRHDFRVSQFQDWVKQVNNTESTNKSMSSNTSSVCEVCKATESMKTCCAFCMTCKKLMCGRCSDRHCRKTIFSDHVIIPVESHDLQSIDNVKCGKHEGEVIKYICLKCNIGVCGICTMTTHDSHSVTDLHTGLKQLKDNMECLRDSVKSRVTQLYDFIKDMDVKQQKLESSKIGTVNEIKEKSADIIMYIKEQEKLLLNDVEDRYKQEREQICTARNEMELAVVSMESLGEFTSDLLQQKPTMKMLPMSQELVFRMDNVIEDSLKIRTNNSVGTWTFVAAKSKTKIGRIKLSGPEIMDNSPNLSLSNSELDTVSSNTQPKMWTLSNFPKAHAISRIGRYGHKKGEFDSPRDVTFLPDGTFAVADTTNNRIQVFNTDGSIIGVIGEGQVKPWGIATTLKGNIAVADALEKCIKIFSVSGILLSRLGQFLCPCGITVDKKGDIVVTDFFSTCIYTMNHLGVVIRKFEFRDRTDRHASGASRVAIGSNGNIVVSDISNASVKIFDERGKHICKIANSDVLASPHGICIDSHNNIFVADMAQQQVSIFNMAGCYLHRLFPHNGHLKDPLGLAISDNSVLVITEGKTNQVGVYKVECSSHSLVVRFSNKAATM